MSLAVACSGGGSREEARRVEASADRKSTAREGAEAEELSTQEFCAALKKLAPRDEQDSAKDRDSAEQFRAEVGRFRSLAEQAPSEVRDDMIVFVSALEKMADRIDEIEKKNRRSTASATSTIAGPLPGDAEFTNDFNEAFAEFGSEFLELMSIIMSPEVIRSTKEIDTFLRERCGFSEEEIETLGLSGADSADEEASASDTVDFGLSSPECSGAGAPTVEDDSHKSSDDSDSEAILEDDADLLERLRTETMSASHPEVCHLADTALLLLTQQGGRDLLDVQIDPAEGAVSPENSQAVRLCDEILDAWGRVAGERDVVVEVSLAQFSLESEPGGSQAGPEENAAPKTLATGDSTTGRCRPGSG